MKVQSIGEKLTNPDGDTLTVETAETYGVILKIGTAEFWVDDAEELIKSMRRLAFSEERRESR